ncbi:hypothetical protein RF55_23752, partial [Lasius niger]
MEGKQNDKLPHVVTVNDGNLPASAAGTWIVGVPPTMEDERRRLEEEERLLATSGEEEATLLRSDKDRGNSQSRAKEFKPMKTQSRRDEVRHAKFFIRKHDESLRNGRELTAIDLEHYHRSVAVIKKYDALDKEEAGTSGKRNRSQDISGRGGQKRSRNESSKGLDTKASDGKKEEGRRNDPQHKKGSGKNLMDKIRFLDNMPLNEILKQDMKVYIID